MKSKILFGLFALLNRIFTDLCKPWLFNARNCRGFRNSQRLYLLTDWRTILLGLCHVEKCLPLSFPYIDPQIDPNQPY